MSNRMQKEVTFPLKIIFWETTIQCNLHCKYCRRISEKKESELTTKQAKKLINQIYELSITQNTPIILIFSGGEPLTRPDIFELIEYASEKNINTALASNGTMINEDIAKKLAKTNLHRVAISIDSPIPEIHDKIRGQTGSFLAALEGIKFLQKHNINVQINSTFSRDNINRFNDMLNFIESLNVCAWHIFLFVPVGCGSNLPDKQKLSPDEIETTLKLIYKYSQRTNIQIKPTCAPQYYRILKQNNALTDKNIWHRYTRGCLAGINVCFISATGKIFPCGYLPIEAGDIRKSDISKIWKNSPLFQKLRNFSYIKGKCSRCKYLKYCGGCRAQAHAKTNDLLNEDPNCIYQT